jgi:hypothetical protein
MSEFKKGQLVAVRDADDCEWKLRVYGHCSPEGLHFCTGLERANPPCWWNKICPAEVIWPHVYLCTDQLIREQLVEQRDLHERQVQWLCEQLQNIGDRNGVQECPPSPHQDCRRGNCADCWAQASLEAVKEEPCQQ